MIPEFDRVVSSYKFRDELYLGRYGTDFRVHWRDCEPLNLSHYRFSVLTRCISKEKNINSGSLLDIE
jgi:hypothetical protein